MTDLTDYKNVCRVCLSAPKDANSVTIIDTLKSGRGSTYIEVLVECASCMLNTDECFSKILCQKCATIIENFYELKQQVIANEGILLFLKSTGSNIKVEEDIKPKYIPETVETREPRIILERIREPSVKNETDDEYNDPSFEPIVENGDSSSDHENETPKIWKCEFCDEVFDLQSKYLEHLKEAHKKNKRVECPMCEKVFFKKFEVKKHMEVHDLVCKVCFLPFQDEAEAAGHSHDLKENCFYACQHCDKQFEKRQQLTKHSKEHSSEESSLCTICGKLLTSSGNLRAHMRSHLGIKKFKCGECGKEFLHKTTLKNHSRIHSPNFESEKRHKCSLCGKPFLRKVDCKRHEETHNTIPKYECPFCLKKFKTKAVLHLHKRIHTSDRVYPCDVCHETFTIKNNLVVHQRRHTGEKPFVCATCGAAYPRLISLKAHQRVHTTDAERPFICPVCNKGFMRKEMLSFHMWSHTKEKNFSCPFCSTKVKTKRYLRKHVRLFHHTELTDVS